MMHLTLFQPVLSSFYLRFVCHHDSRECFHSTALHEGVVRVALHPYMANLPSLRDHFTPIKGEPTFSDRLTELNWYGAIYPEFYLTLLYIYPEEFPDHLF
jgi:hypothetical protein